MANENKDIKRIHATAANIASGTQATIEKQWAFANDTKRIFVHEVGGAFTQFPNATETILASGAVDFTGDQSHGGYGITGIRDAAFVDTDTLAIDHDTGLWSLTSSVAEKFVATVFIFDDSDWNNDMIIYQSAANSWDFYTGDQAQLRFVAAAFSFEDSPYSEGDLTIDKPDVSTWEIATPSTVALKLIGDDIVFKDTDQAALLTLANNSNTEWSFTTTIAQKFVATSFVFEDSDYATGDLTFDKTAADIWGISTGTLASQTFTATSIIFDDADYANNMTFSQSAADAWTISTGTVASETFKATSFRFMDPAVQDVFALTIDQTSSQAWKISSDSSATMLMTFDSITFEDTVYTTADLKFDKTAADTWLIGSDTTCTWMIGTYTNHSKFESDGTLLFEGAAVVWDDLNFDPVRSGGPAASRPDEVTINNVYHNEFTSSNNQSCGSVAEIPHGAKLSGTLYPHIHVFLKASESAGTTGVTFTFYWELRQSGGTTSGSVSLAVTSAQLTANTHNFVKYDATGFTGPTELGSQLAVTIARTAGDAGDVIVPTYGVHYEIDTVGSRAVSTK